jgi:hypothetical protein
VLTTDARERQGGGHRDRRPVPEASAGRLGEVRGAGIYYAATELEARGCAGETQLTPDDLDGTWTALGRSPLPFETNVPAVFAAGDVRSGSMKTGRGRVGEGASAVSSVHRAVGVLAVRRQRAGPNPAMRRRVD